MLDNSVFALERINEDARGFFKMLFCLYKGVEVSYKAPREFSSIDSFLAAALAGDLQALQGRDEEHRKKFFIRLLCSLREMNEWNGKALFRSDVAFEALLIFLAQGNPTSFNLSLLNEASGVDPRTLKTYVEILVELGLASRQKAFLVPCAAMIKSDAYSLADPAFMLFLLGIFHREDVYWTMGLGDRTILYRILYIWALARLQAACASSIEPESSDVVLGVQESLFPESELPAAGDDKSAENNRAAAEEELEARLSGFRIEYMLARDGRRIDFVLVLDMTEEERRKHYERLFNEREEEIKKLPRRLRKALEEEGALRPEIKFEPKLVFPVVLKTDPIVKKEKVVDLEWFMENEKRAPLGIVLHPGRELRRISQRVWAVPLSALK